MNIPENLKYSQDHEWLKVDGEFALVGITAHAANELGDIVFLDIPSVGETLDKDEVFGSIEAVKTVADLLLPVAGEVVEFNEALEGERPREQRSLRRRLDCQDQNDRTRSGC